MPRHELIQSLLERRTSWRTLLVMGPKDSGKTTFATELGRRLAEAGEVLRIDCDTGQTSIGPPATIGAVRESVDESDPEPVALRFVGSTSPSGHVPQLLAGLIRLLRIGAAPPHRWTLVDDSGYYAAGGGAELHHLTADVVEPDHLVAFQTAERELEPLLAVWEGRAGTEVHRLPVPAEARSRSRDERRRFRRDRFARHFEGAQERTLDLSRLGLHGWVPDLARGERVRHLLLGLCDDRGFLISLARLEEVDVAAGRLVVLAPPFEEERVASVAFGSLRLEPEEVGRR